LTKLRPVAYTALLERFATSDRDARERFLRRVGTRYFLAKGAPGGERRPVVALDGIVTMTLFEEPAPAARALVVPSARIVPGLGARISALFTEAFAIDKDVLLDTAAPAAAGAPGPGVPPGATIVEDQPTRVKVAARVPEGGGYVVLLDSYDPNWIAEVDGQRAPLLEADGLFRTVRVAPGRHAVVFRYRSRPLLIGLSISLATALGLVVACVLVRPTFGVAR
jgi:Bacterial membrane protein YfhO